MARRFSLRLALIVAVGLAVRLVYLWASRKGTCNFLYPADRPPGVRRRRAVDRVGQSADGGRGAVRRDAVDGGTGAGPDAVA